MKYNSKQIAHADHKIVHARRKLARRFFMSLFLFIGLVLGGIYLSNDDITFDELLKVETPVGLATVMGVVGNVSTVDDRKKRGKIIKNRIHIIDEDQIDYDAAFAGPSGRNMPNIPLKAGEYWHTFSTTHKMPPKARSNFESGDIASNLTNELEIVMGGYEDQLFDLAEQGPGKGFMIVFEICATGEKFIGGTMCKPVILDSGNWVSEDNTALTCIFRNENGRLWLKYTGTTPTQAPETVAADATTITLTSNPQYQLTDGSAAAASITSFTSVTDADIGRVVTILGSGGSFPSTIESGNDFILNGGATWTANAGAQISFLIFKDDTSTYKFIEVANSRIS